MPSFLSPRLILASGSAYRRELLGRLRLPFETIAPNIDETPHPSELPQDTALRLAYEKAAAVGKNHPGAIVIGSDQVAALGNTPIGKPGTHEKALRQLIAMRGKHVLFHTALCVWDGRQPDPEKTVQKTTVPTSVTFRHLPEAELDAYLHAERPYDCAGSAKNEALGIILLEKIKSEDPTALTGLPLIALTTMLRHCGIRFFQETPSL
ncbi:MAG: Maf family nucleotide pyrophosphatase [Oxalobacter formigenes]|nr:Maf family nucleotide pyrophosphatase [Oxalobacter formigenes]